MVAEELVVMGGVDCVNVIAVVVSVEDVETDGIVGGAVASRGGSLEVSAVDTCGGGGIVGKVVVSQHSGGGGGGGLLFHHSSQ